MTYKQLLKLDYERLTYEQFLYTCAKNNRTPFRILKFDNSYERTTLIILSKTMNGGIATRHMTFTKDGADTVIDMFEHDFADIQTENVDEVI